MPKQRSTTMHSGRSPAIDMSIGRTYALAGPQDQAFAPLRRVGSPCLRLRDPVSNTWAQYYLGVALEGTSDIDGAKAAYGAVVDRWGKARPRSVTADLASARLSALAAKTKK
jgi:serine/threonine-protein kinase